MVSLDAVGNTTKAVTKGFAIGSAVIAAVALFASFIETIGSRARRSTDDRLRELFRNLFDDCQINVADPKIFIGLLIGGSMAFLFSALAIRAVGRTAGVVVQEVRRQFADGKIMTGEKQPDYGPVIDICTAASLRELATPALLAVLTPVIIGFGINYFALGAFLAAVILTGQLMANFLSNAGGAWDNAKKYIEDGHEGGKGSEAHKAAVIGDTVGDPFKDTAGPALNPLIKVMNLVSLLILPAIISIADGQLRPALGRPLRHRRRGPRGAHRRGGVLEAQGRVLDASGPAAESPTRPRRHLTTVLVRCAVREKRTSHRTSRMAAASREGRPDKPAWGSAKMKPPAERAALAILGGVTAAAALAGGTRAFRRWSPGPCRRRRRRPRQPGVTRPGPPPFAHGLATSASSASPAPARRHRPARPAASGSRCSR